MKSDHRLQVVIDLVLLSVLFWVAHYWFSRHFGLYEDDITIIPGAFKMSFGELMRFVYSYITQFQGQGRPLHHSFIYLFSWVGWRIAGLWGPFLIGYLITSINIGLFYWLLRRVTNRPFALIGGLAYLLFSADTTQAFLTLSLGLQPSITLILLSFHGYLSNRRLLAYILAFISPFYYETPFLVFLAAPLLKKGWNRSLLKEFLFHGLILAVMLGSVFFLRLRMGEGRVEGLTLHQMLSTSVRQMILGPLTALRTYLSRPLRPVLVINLQIAIAMGLSAIAIAWILWRAEPIIPFRLRELWEGLKPRRILPLPDEVRMLGRLVVAGLVMLVMAYPLTFTIDATSTGGRNTRVHAAAVMGAALLIACAGMFLLMLLKAWGRRHVGTVALAVFFALLVGFGFVLQNDYVNAWQYQKQFWTELIPLIPDAGENTVVFIQPDGLRDVYQIQANTWNLPRILNQIYAFPDSMTNVPYVVRLAPDWEKYILSEDGKFQINILSTVAPGDYFGEVDSRQVIFIETASGHLVRHTDVLTINGREYPLKSPSAPVLPSLPHDILYDLLIASN